MPSLLANAVAAAPLLIIRVLLSFARVLAPRKKVTIVLSTSDRPAPETRISNQACVLALRLAGADVLPAPPPLAGSDISAIMDAADALLLAGGEDTAHGDPPVGAVNPPRDEMERALIAAALERDIPILGICRGMQMLALAAGGKIGTHKHDPEKLRGHKSSLFKPIFHEVEVEPDSKLRKALGKDRVKTFSVHRNHVADSGKAKVAAISLDDGMIEGIEFQRRDFVLGVQWHPEIRSIFNPSAAAVIRAFVDTAVDAKKKRMENNVS